MTAETGHDRRLTLLVRAYCHLCDDMREAATPVAELSGWRIEELDVDTDPALERRWGEYVPVLLAGDRELCRYRFDRRPVEAFLLAGGGAKSR